jgi:hypothetical protein
MDGSGSSGFDMSKMSTAEKLLAGGSILLLIDSFFPWQSADPGGLGDLLGVDLSFNMWQASGAIFGVLAGLLAIALIVVGVLSMTGSMANMNMGTLSADKLVGWLGAGVFVFGILKFIFALTASPAWGAFVGLILLIAIGYGAWQKMQATGGMTMGGGMSGGGTTMGGPPPSAPPPSTPPPSTPPPSAPPPSGGMPPDDTTPGV